MAPELTCPVCYAPAEAVREAYVEVMVNGRWLCWWSRVLTYTHAIAPEHEVHLGAYFSLPDSTKVVKSSREENDGSAEAA